MSLEEAISKRRSVRNFEDKQLTRDQISQLLWAAQGITETARGFRAAPSAGALYPLEVYVATADGVEHYLPEKHATQQISNKDVRGQLQLASYNQPCIGDAPAVFIISAIPARTERKYRERAMRYVLIEVGHAGQNILLQAQAMGLGGVPVGAYNDKEIASILSLPENEQAIYLIPVGVPKK